jgi:hypothetical protein
LDVFAHEDAVYGLSVSPVNDNIFASSSDDGRGSHLGHPRVTPRRILLSGKLSISLSQHHV